MINLISFIGFIIILIIYLIIQYKNQGKLDKKIDEFCNKHYKKIWIIFIIILFVSVIYKFGELPVFFGMDETAAIYDATCLAKYGTDRNMEEYPLYLKNFGTGQSALCAYLTALYIKIFGQNSISYRLPTLIMYLIGVISSYLLIAKTKDKKTALIFTFLIITCPWTIMNAREALNCNLYGGMLMLDLYLMNKARKNYQYILAGVTIGITLYTYCLSWITLPIFLLTWIIYMLYIKKINIKQIILLGIPIIIFAIPLIYFLLLNYGIVKQTKLGIFTLPILDRFGANVIKLSNIITYGKNSIKTIFRAQNTIYPLYVILFIIGYILAWIETIKTIKEKKYNITTIIVLAFTTILIGLLCASVPTPNKANALYIPILYFVTIAILKISNKPITLILTVLIISMLFLNFENYYYNRYSISDGGYYKERYLQDIVRKIESSEKTKETKKIMMIFRCASHIYIALENKMSPNEYVNTVEKESFINMANENDSRITRIGNYYYMYRDKENFEEKVRQFENDENIIIMTNEYKNEIDYIKTKGYKEEKYYYYTILTKNVPFTMENK